MAKKKQSNGIVTASVFGVIAVIVYISILLVSPLVLLFNSPAGYGEMFSYVYFFTVSLAFGATTWFLLIRKGTLKEHNLLLSLISGFFISLIMGINSMVIEIQNIIRSEMELVAVPQYMQSMVMQIPKVGDPIILFLLAYVSFSVFFFIGHVRRREWKKLLLYLVPVAVFFIIYFLLYGMIGSILV